MFKGIDFEKYSMKLEQNINLVPPFSKYSKAWLSFENLIFYVKGCG